MNEAALIRAQLDSVRSELAEVFPHLSDDILGWAPSEGMRTIHGQFAEIFGTERDLQDRITNAPSRTFEELEAPAWDTTTVDGLVALLEATRVETLALLDSMTDEALAQPTEISADWADFLCLQTVPAAELFRFIARHESYHAGQLVSYLWARGDNPYEWD